MISAELDLLRTQLLEAVVDPAVEPWEIPAMAGLIQRLSPDDPVLAAVAAPDPTPDLAALAAETLDQILAIDEDDDESESWDALCMLDELCAAATFLGLAEVVRPFAAQASACIRAFPEAWAVHGEVAQALLSERAPLAGDPALLLWQAVRDSADDVNVAEDEEGAPLLVRLDLGVDQVFFLRDFAPVLLAASGNLPEDLPHATLAAGPGWELALTVDDQDGPIVLLAGIEGQFSRNGLALVSEAVPDGQRCPAQPGDWVVTLDNRRVSFRIAP